MPKQQQQQQQQQPVLSRLLVDRNAKLNFNIYRSFLEIYPPLPLSHSHNCTTFPASNYSTILILPQSSFYYLKFVEEEEAENFTLLVK